MNASNLGEGVLQITHNSQKKGSNLYHFAEVRFGSLASLGSALQAETPTYALTPLPNVLKGVDSRGRAQTYRARYSVDSMSLTEGREIPDSLRVLNADKLGEGVAEIAGSDDAATDSDGVTWHGYHARVLYESEAALAKAWESGTLPKYLQGLARNWFGGWSPATYTAEYAVKR